MDKFEKRIQRQKLRKIPEEWRAVILQAAEEGTAGEAQRQKPFVLHACLVAWRELFQPCRYAWSGMAALWLAFWIINSQTRPVERPMRIATSTHGSSQQIRLVEEQRQVMAELTGSIGLSPAEPPRQARPKPRSERLLEARSC